MKRLVLRKEAMRPRCLLFLYPGGSGEEVTHVPGSAESYESAVILFCCPMESRLSTSRTRHVGHNLETHLDIITGLVTDSVVNSPSPARG